jgi:hypothetical protein
MKRVALAVLAAVLIAGIGPVPARVRAAWHLESGPPPAAGEVLQEVGVGPGAHPREVCRWTSEPAGGCDLLLLYIGRGGSCPVICIVVLDRRAAPDHERPSGSGWLCGCREVVEGVRELLAW